MLFILKVAGPCTKYVYNTVVDIQSHRFCSISFSSANDGRKHRWRISEDATYLHDSCTGVILQKVVPSVFRQHLAFNPRFLLDRIWHAAAVATVHNNQTFNLIHHNTTLNHILQRIYYEVKNIQKGNSLDWISTFQKSVHLLNWPSCKILDWKEVSETLKWKKIRSSELIQIDQGQPCIYLWDLVKQQAFPLGGCCINLLKQ